MSLFMMRAILDYSIDTIMLGPIPIHVWGLFVAFGFITATYLAVRWADGARVRREDILDFAVWALVSAFVGARLGNVIFYDFASYIERPIDIFKVWEGGLSSFGGFVGALIAGVIFVRRRRISMIALSDALLAATPFGMAIGRIGCHLTREHPGIPCAGTFCVPFPDGVRRLDLGLLEIPLALVIGLAAYALRRPLIRMPGATTAFVLIAYGFVRLILDAYRITDERYLGWTPAQWGSAALVVFGMYVLWVSRRYRP